MKGCGIYFVLIFAVFLRLFNLSSGDPLGDEVLYAFRSIGPLDYDVAEFQTTPWQWYDGNIPWWTKLSFHDHPPLVFWIQNFFMRIFGENLFAFRLPSAILGLASVYLLFKLGSVLFSPVAGLISALVLAVTANHVLISRVGLQESYVIFFLLLFSYALIRSLKNEKFFWLSGIALGLGFLTKFTAFVAVPILFVYYFIFRRDYFLNKNFGLMLLLVTAISSPVLVYNYELYRAVGHFDFQFSYILGQNPEVWKIAPGKEEAGTILVRIRNFTPNLIQSNSWLFLLISFFGLTALFKSRFLLISLGFLVFFIVGFIGPQMRFLSMLTPFLSLGIGVLVSRYRSKNVILSVSEGSPTLDSVSNNRFFAGPFASLRARSARLRITKKRLLNIVIIGLFTAFIIFETIYSINTQLIYKPFGTSPWFYSQKLRLENYNWGFAELGKYLDAELSGKMPAFVFDARYKFIEDIQAEAVGTYKQKGFEPYPALIIYDGNMLNAPQLWYLDRLQIYHGWPVLRTEDYRNFLAQNGEDYFTRAGFKYFYFIFPTTNVPLKKTERLTETGAIFEEELAVKGIVSTVIKNKMHNDVFRIYKF